MVATSQILKPCAPGRPLQSGFWWTTSVFLVAAMLAMGSSVAPAVALAADAGPRTVAVHVDLPVQWRGNAALRGGRGHFRFVALLRPGTAEAGANRLLSLCALEQPPTQTLGLWGGEQVALHYAGAALEREPAVELAGDSHWPRAAGDELSVALEAGIRLDNSRAMPWPEQPGSLSSSLLEHGGVRGIEALARVDPPFVRPPVDYSRKRHALAFHVATRAVVRLLGPSAEGGLVGQASALELGGRPAIDSTLVGCATAEGGSCSEADLSLANLFQPRWRPGAAGSWSAVELADGAGCAEALSLLPVGGDEPG